MKGLIPKTKFFDVISVNLIILVIYSYLNIKESQLV